MSDALPAFMKDAVPVDDSASSSDSPPAFMKDAVPVDDSTPTASSVAIPKLADGDYRNELVKRLKEGDSKQQISDFAKSQGNTIENLDDVIAYRDNRANKNNPHKVSNVLINDDGKPPADNLHKKIGRVIQSIAGPDEAMPTGIGTVRKLVAGVLRAPVEIAEGLGQLGLRAQGAITGDDDTARLKQLQLSQESDAIDAPNANSTAYSLGKLAGNVAETAALPMGAVETGAGKVANVLATGAKRALAGGAASGLSGASMTPEEQNNRIATGALLTPLAVPAVEKVIGVLGAKIGDQYNKIAGQGLGKNIYDNTGNLTRYGAVLKARLQSVHKHLPEPFIDDTLKQIATVNPKTLAPDRALVADSLAAKEGVPLTGAMKSGDAKGVQDFGSMQTGAIGGKSGQEAAVARNQDIDDAVLSNVRSIGSGATSDTASTNVAKKVNAKYDAAKASVDRLYQPLNNMRIAAPEKLGEIANNARASFGKGGYATLNPAAQHYIGRINNIADDGSPMFGDVWKLSKDINEDLRNATGADRYQLGVIKKSVDDYFTQAANDGSGNISEGAAAQLKQANGAYRQFSKQFGENPVKFGGNTTIPDQAGKAVQKIIAQAKSDDGINPAQVESAIFGNAKALDSAGSKQAVNTIGRLVKAVPEVQPHIKDITLNRVVSQMQEGLYTKNVKPGAFQTVIKQAVDGNSELLKAAGFTASDITRLQQNAYLASLKVPPVGAVARGSSATNRGLPSTIAKDRFRAVLALALGAVGEHLAGPGAAITAPILGDAVRAAAGRVADSRLAAKTLSSTVKLLPSAAGKRVGQKIGKVVGAQTARQNAD